LEQAAIHDVGEGAPGRAKRSTPALRVVAWFVRAAKTMGSLSGSLRVAVLTSVECGHFEAPERSGDGRVLSSASWCACGATTLN